MNPKAPAVLFLGVFFLAGAANMLSEMATGAPLLTGDGGEISAHGEPAAPGPEIPRSGKGWSRPINAKVTTAYKAPGPQWASGFHTGVDMAAPSGTQVFAARSGTVVNSDWGGPYGNQIVIRHGNKLYTHYAHLLKQQVRAGQTVKAGEKIGLVGASGTKSSGPHLHFEVRTGPAYGDDINPVPFLK